MYRDFLSSGSGVTPSGEGARGNSSEGARAFCLGLLGCLLIGGAAVGAERSREATASPGSGQVGNLTLHLRSRLPEDAGTNEYRAVERTVQWAGKQTAIVVCDMWDRHWCSGATARVGEMAPHMEKVLTAARQLGVLVVHAPSETMSFYEGTPQRQRAKDAPQAPKPAQLKALPTNCPLPIDDSDGGCDDQPQCKQGQAWKRQHAALTIGPDDVISDNGDQVYNVFRAHGIQNVIIMGVHANMCVLGRSFAIRRLVQLGFNVALMRDLTDTMYNSRQRPRVNHFTGNDLVVAHIERNYCPSLTSADFLGIEPFRFQADTRPRIVFMLAEPEYNTAWSVPDFATRELLPKGYHCSYVFEDPADPNSFPGLLREARIDLLFVSVRRRLLPPAQMQVVRQHLQGGRPLVGIRTASHAWCLKEADSNALAWPDFDVEVLGAKYLGHYGNSRDTGRRTTVRFLPETKQDPLLARIPLEGFESTSHLYKYEKLQSGARVLLTGQVAGEGKVEPVAWTYHAGKSKVFYTSLGNQDDFVSAPFRALLGDSIAWCLAP